MRCVCALLDDLRASTLQKIVCCKAACRALSAGTAVLPDDDLASLCTPAVRALASWEDELEVDALELCFGIATLAEAQLGAGDTARDVMVHLASIELSKLRERAAASGLPTACSALLILIGGMISAKLAADVEPSWLVQIAQDLADSRLSASEGAVRARVLLQIAEVAFGLPRLADAIGVDLELHLDAIERAEESAELAIDHVNLLRCLIWNHADVNDCLHHRQHEQQQQLFGGDDGMARDDKDDDYVRRALAPSAGRTKLIAMLKRWLLGTPAMRLEACTLIRCVCESSPLVMGAWCASDDLPEFVLDAMRSQDHHAVQVAALDAFYCLVQLAGVDCGQAREAQETAILGPRSASAAGTRAREEEEDNGNNNNNFSASAASSFGACLAHSASALASLLLRENEHALTDKQSERAWELLLLASSCPRAGGVERVWDGFDRLVRRLLPCDSVLGAKRLLAIAANVCTAAEWDGAARKAADDSTRRHESTASLVCELSLFALKHLAGGNGGGGSSSVLLMHNSSNVAIDHDILADICTCGAYAITAAQTAQNVASVGAASSAAPGLSGAAGGERERARAADAQQASRVAELSFERLLAPYARQLHELPRALSARLLVLAEAVLIISQCTSSRAQRIHYARSLLAASSAGSRRRYGFGGANVQSDGALSDANGRRAANILTAIALHALALPGIEASVPLLPSRLLAQVVKDDATRHAEEAAASTDSLLAVPHTPQLVLQAWLSSRASAQRWSSHSLSFAIEIVYAQVFVCLSSELEHQQHTTAASVQPSQLGENKAATAMRTSELRAALAALFGAHEAELCALESDHTLCRLLRLWNCAFAAAAIPVHCSRTMHALCDALDSRRAFGKMAVESLRFRFALSHACDAPGSSCSQALRCWLADEAEFLSAWAEQGSGANEPFAAQRSSAADANQQHGIGVDKLIYGRGALAELTRSADVHMVELIAHLLHDWPALGSQQSGSSVAVDDDDEPAAWFMGIEALIDFARASLAAGGHATACVYERKGLLPALGRTFALLAEAFDAATKPTFERVLGALTRALSLCEMVVSHGVRIEPAGAEVLSMLAQALPAWLRVVKAAADSRGVVQLLKTTSALLDSGHFRDGGAGGSELGSADGTAPRASMDMVAMINEVVGLLAPPALNQSGERMQAVAAAALIRLAEHAPASVRDALTAPARARAPAQPARHGLVLLLGSTENATVAHALELLAVLLRSDDPLLLLSALGTSASALTLTLLNSLSGSEEPALLHAAVAVIVALRDTSPSFWRAFRAEAWNGLVLRSMVRRGLFGAAHSSAPEQAGTTAERRQSVALACTTFALLILTEPRGEWLTSFLARHQAEVSSLVAQASEPTGKGASTTCARLRKEQATLLHLLAPTAGALEGAPTAACNASE